MPDYGWYIEMEKRNLLNEADQAWFNEVKRRGLAPDSDQRPNTFLQDNPDQVDKMAESVMLAGSMGMDPDQAYDMHGELTKQMAEQELSFSQEVKNGIVGGFRVAGATFASLGSGIAGGYAGIFGLPTISSKPDEWIEWKPGLLQAAFSEDITLQDVEATVQEVASGPPGAFIKTEEEAKVMELMDKIPELAGKGWQLIGEESIDLAIEARRAVQGPDADVSDLEQAKQVVVPLLGTVGEVSGEFAEFLPMASSKAKGVINKVKETDFYKKLTPKEKLDLSDKVVETVEQAPDLTEEQIIEAVEPQVTETGEVLPEQRIRDLEKGAVETVETPIIEEPVTPLDATMSTERLITEVKNDPVLPEIQRLRFTESLRNVKTEKGKANIIKGIENNRALAIERKKTYAIQTSKRLQKVDNLRKAMKFPTVKNMTMKQMQEWQTVLEPFQKDDIFLTQRQLETIDNTDLAGVKTIREVREKFSDRTGIPVDEIENITVDSFDRMRYDTSLAQQTPFYKVMVEDYHNSTLSAEERYLDFEAESNSLATAARESRKRGKLEKLIPTDELVFDYLSASDKATASKKMTPQELEYAQFLEGKFAEALEYLIDTESLKTGRENYITNIRRDFWETLKEEGIKAAGKEILNQQKLDEQTFNILDQMTGDILPLNKFFQFSMRRTGDITPTKNVAKAAAHYFKTLEKKKALDSFMPKMMVFVDALTPQAKTKKGLIKDQTLNTFVKEWINTKKGRPSKLALTPGSKTDLVTKSLKGFISMMDLGLNIPVGMAATVGEGITTYVGLGKKNMSKGIKRLNSRKGKSITSKYKNFVGKSIWEQLAEPSAALSDKMTSAMFGFFNQSAVRANKIYLLGKLTDSEFNSGKISPERLAEIKVEMGKYRGIPDMKSILGTTTEGGLLTQYKTWAIPILSTTTRNLGTMAKNVMDKSKKGALKTEEFNEFKNAIEATAAALIAISILPEDDQSFIGNLKAKIKRESLTILGALDPTLWTAGPRMLQWANEVAEISKEIITLEGYSEDAPMELRGKLKGVEHAKGLVTPRALTQLQAEETTGLAN